MPQFPQIKSYLPQPLSTTPSRGEPRLPDAIPRARRSAQRMARDPSGSLLAEMT